MEKKERKPRGRNPANPKPTMAQEIEKMRTKIGSLSESIRVNNERLEGIEEKMVAVLNAVAQGSQPSSHFAVG